MKLIIDINDEMRDWLINGFPDEEDAVRLLDIVKNGTPIAEACDCIQREFALEPFEVFDDEEWISRDICKYLNSLPSVTPKQRTGQWIIIDDCEQFIAKCSECGRIEDSRMISKYPYCHCGAKIQEVKL